LLFYFEGYISKYDEIPKHEIVLDCIGVKEEDETSSLTPFCSYLSIIMLIEIK